MGPGVWVCCGLAPFDEVTFWVGGRSKRETLVRYPRERRQVMMRYVGLHEVISGITGECIKGRKISQSPLLPLIQ